MGSILYNLYILISRLGFLEFPFTSSTEVASVDAPIISFQDTCPYVPCNSGSPFSSGGVVLDALADRRKQREPCSV